MTAYAIQAAEVLEGEDTDLTDTLTKENLQKIYDIYGKQNNGQTVPEANTNNSKNLFLIGAGSFAFHQFWVQIFHNYTDKKIWKEVFFL